MSAIGRGFINPFRNKARAVVVVVLLSLVTGFFALMVQATFASRERVLHITVGKLVPDGSAPVTNDVAAHGVKEALHTKR